MRIVSFTNCLEFEFPGGNFLKNAICLGDVDNDGLNELVVGNEKGSVAIFKGESKRPVCVASNLGIITAIAIGDVLNVGKNVLFVVTDNGLIRLYDFEKDSLVDCSRKPMIPFHTQHIPANVKVVFIGDVNADGFCEVVVGLTDRVVRTFKWHSDGKTVKDKLVGKLVGLNKWEFAEQIGTITLHKTDDDKPCIIVAQPCGTFLTLRVEPKGNENVVEPLDESMGEFLTKISMSLEPLVSAKLRNSEICGNIVNKFDDGVRGPSLAVANLDGILMLVRHGKILWKRTVDHELFAVNCVDWTRDGNEEVVACAWDGTTFIVKHNNEGIQFAFRESVCAFTSGMYGLKKKQTACLVYCTFSDTICLYYDVSIPYMIPTTLTETLKENEEYLTLIKKLNIDPNDSGKLKRLHEKILYGARS